MFCVLCFVFPDRCFQNACFVFPNRYMFQERPRPCFGRASRAFSPPDSGPARKMPTFHINKAQNGGLGADFGPKNGFGPCTSAQEAAPVFFPVLVPSKRVSRSPKTRVLCFFAPVFPKRVIRRCLSVGVVFLSIGSIKPVFLTRVLCFAACANVSGIPQNVF